MGMSMGQSFSQRIRQTHRISNSLRLSQSICIQVQNFALGLRLQLIQVLRDEEYKPRATCPSCFRELTPAEIIRGFNTDPNDFTTSCSACGFRFQPTLVCLGNGTSIEMPFWCQSQTLAHLSGKEHLSPEHLAAEHPAIYRSAIVHHGGICQAFAKVGIIYPFEEISDWRNKIRPFLGRMPDTIIAECVNASVSIIRKMRRELGIGKYSLRATLVEMGIEG